MLRQCTCDGFKEDALGCVPSLDAEEVRDICSQITRTYSASYATIKTNTQYLQALFGVFKRPTGSLAAHISGLECFQALHTGIDSTPKAYGPNAPAGVYYPWDFALYEVPLAWVYQCVYQSGVQISPEKKGVTCNRFERAQTLEQAGEFTTISKSGYNNYHYLIIIGII